jgi:hypothetical protein
LGKKTGNVVRDRRGVKGDPTLTLDLRGVTFWKALDAVASQAGASVSPYQPDSSVALVPKALHTVPVSYDGIFRSAVRRLDLSRDLETGTRGGIAHVEVAWEPRFLPLLLEVRSYALTFAPDAAGKKLQVKRQGTGMQDVHGRTAVEVELPFAAPERSSPAVALLKGEFTVIGAPGLTPVRFDRLSPIGKGGKRSAKATANGVSIDLTRLTVLDTDHWLVRVGVSYPPGGPRFESYQQLSWLIYNRIYLEKGGGKVRFTPRPADERVRKQDDNHALIEYHFVQERGRTPKLGRPGDWTLVYVAPERFVEATGSFAFKDMPLP